MPMARIETIRVTKQADVDVELAKRSRSKQLREALSMSERHAPHTSPRCVMVPFLLKTQQARNPACSRVRRTATDTVSTQAPVLVSVSISGTYAMGTTDILPHDGPEILGGDPIREHCTLPCHPGSDGMSRPSEAQPNDALNRAGLSGLADKIKNAYAAQVSRSIEHR